MINMIKITKILIGLQIALIPATSIANDSLDKDITLGRARVLIERASDGLEKLSKSHKSNISERWSDSVQSKASDICSFVEAELRKQHLNDKDMSLCSVE